MNRELSPDTLAELESLRRDAAANAERNDAARTINAVVCAVAVMRAVDPFEDDVPLIE
jgi:hypothetical protein